MNPVVRKISVAMMNSPSNLPQTHRQKWRGWVQGKKTDGKVGWYQKEYAEKMVKYRINQFGIEKQKSTLKEKRQIENLLSGYKVRAIVSREAMRDQHKDELGWSRRKKDDFTGVFTTGPW